MNQQERSRFLVGLRRDQLGSTKYGARLLKKSCLSPLISKNLKLKKVNKNSVPEPISSVFRFLYALWTFVNVFCMNILCLFHVFISCSISWIHYICYILFKISHFIMRSYLPNPSARAGYDTRSIFKRSLTGLNSEFSFS